MQNVQVNSWQNCKNILVIRPDNMGDVIMMSPALRALKETFGCRITLLTSKMGSLITPHISYIDETLVYDLPCVKTSNSLQPGDCLDLIEKLKALHFDGAIIATVYSQNPLPAAMIAFMAGIPLRLAYCRENPYELLTHWIPDKEPYSFIVHQVIRELNMVAYIGARTNDDTLSLSYHKDAYHTAIEKLTLVGVNTSKPWLILHAGVSEVKREYPLSLWIKTVARLSEVTDTQILLTGVDTEKQLSDKIYEGSGKGTFSVAGLFNIEEFIAVVSYAQLVISVNTSTVHIAAAVNTPVIVLYALTNPQHTPWKVPSVVLPYKVPRNRQSKNEVIKYVNKRYFEQIITPPSPARIVRNAIKLLSQTHATHELPLNNLSLIN